MIRVNLLRRLPKPRVYKGHHKRDVFGKMFSRAEETRDYRLRHPGQRKKWDATYRQSAAGTQAHQTYNESAKGRRKVADLHLKRKYGHGLAEKQAKYDQQRGLCGVCGAPLSVRLDECHWDHHHESGKMRDILHPRCNIAVGFIESDLQHLVLEYLKRHNNV